MSDLILELGDVESRSARRVSSQSEETFGQYMTPLWVAEALVEKYFSDLGPRDRVLEPSCGVGRFLDALAVVHPNVRRAGVEIDPALAETARARGHSVLTGDFTSADLSPLRLRPTAIVGNPPFTASVIDQFLARAHGILPAGGRVGFVLPAYYFQTSLKVDGLSRRWSLQSDQIPRDVFPGLSLPLCFTVFSKDRKRTLVGFALYGTAAAVSRWAKRYQSVAVEGGAPGVPVWRSVVETALRDLGGESDLPTLYAALEGQRPTPNPHWKAKVRQIVQERCIRTGPARYALN